MIAATAGTKIGFKNSCVKIREFAKVDTVQAAFAANQLWPCSSMHTTG